MAESCPEFETLLDNIVVGPNKRMHVNNEVLRELFQNNECSDSSESGCSGDSDLSMNILSSIQQSVRSDNEEVVSPSTQVS